MDISPVVRRSIWRQQLIELGDRVVALVFWDGDGYDSASRRARVAGPHAELLEAFDKLAPTFGDCDFDIYSEK